ncbi:MAG: type II CRISPR RNA-guided endonuclease Cas9, partial [Opitutales bacterium]|nr:type II CRISPR RNA-guided endonuclease Cas9 [Opitutales bacterium]
MNARKKTTYTLGLDLGSQSIGWAICPCDENGKIVSTEDLGVRIFDDGREAKSHEPLAVGRRLAKQTARRRKRAFMRRQALFNFLRGENLLPADPQDSRKLAECDPYALRAKATKIKIERHEIGRVLLHINKRRGFKSSRKEAQSEDKEVQGMKKGIANLQAKTKNQTLGEILHDKRQKNWRKPVRFRPQTSGSTNHWEIYPERSMYEEEIRAIFKKQAEFYPDLNEEKLKKALHIIINQRPLKKPKVGSCRFLTDESRAPLALPSQQRFRIFQEINNLELRQNLSFRFLTKEERKLIAEQLLITAKETNLLNKKGELTFSKIKTKILKDSSAFLNLEEMGRKNLQGDLAAQALSKDECFGKKWFDLSLEDQDRIVLKLIGAEDKELQDEDDAVHAWLVSEWGLNDNHAQACLNAKLPDGYGRLGRTALGKILPYLEKGFIYSEAVAESGLKDPLANIKNRSELPYYGEILENYTMPHPSHGKHGVPDIPEVKFGRIPNPTVHIGLNQLRRVVNAIIHKYGPPEVIRIELARDFAFSAEQTNKLKKKQTENRKRNEIAREAVEKAGHDASKRENIVRYKLWEELHSDPLQRFCPFSGKIISIENLFSSEIE